MYRIGIIFNKLFMIIVIIGIVIVMCASDDVKPALSENFYVLKSCTSSVELNRRKVETRVSTFPPILQRLGTRTAILPVEQNSSSRDNVKFMNGKTKLHQRFMNEERPGRKIIDDTPLVTLNINRRGSRGRYDEPQLFVRKKHLPEIQNLTSGDEKMNNKNEASIISIKSA